MLAKIFKFTAKRPRNAVDAIIVRNDPNPGKEEKGPRIEPQGALNSIKTPENQQERDRDLNSLIHFLAVNKLNADWALTKKYIEANVLVSGQVLCEKNPRVIARAGIGPFDALRSHAK